MFVYDWDQILVIAVILFTFMRILLRYIFSQLINMINSRNNHGKCGN